MKQLFPLLFSSFRDSTYTDADGNYADDDYNGEKMHYSMLKFATKTNKKLPLKLHISINGMLFKV